VQNCPGTDELSRWLTDALPASRMGLIEAHVACCAVCQAAVEELLAQPTAKRVLREESKDQAEAEFLQRLAQRAPLALASLPPTISPRDSPPSLLSRPSRVMKSSKRSAAAAWASSTGPGSVT
jgi:hypothetical protein